MSYIAESKIVHSDLAARNVLMTASDNEKSKYLAKIGDLGLSKVVREDANYYTANNKSIPVKWAAPEVIEYGKHSEMSDVWSFGITMWEVFSFGKTPYPAMNNQETLEEVTKGYRLPIPKDCPQEVYELMQMCWQIEPSARPKFSVLYAKLLPLLKNVEQNYPVSQDKGEEDVYNNTI